MDMGLPDKQRYGYLPRPALCLILRQCGGIQEPITGTGMEVSLRLVALLVAGVLMISRYSTGTRQLASPRLGYLLQMALPHSILRQCGGIQVPTTGTGMEARLRQPTIAGTQTLI